jgi:hypothetical protein
MSVRSTVRILRLAAAALVLLFTATGCGVISLAPASWAAKASPVVSNGIEKKSPLQIEKAAAAALKAAGSLHLVATATTAEDGAMRMDLKIRGSACTGTMLFHHITFQITVIGSAAYMKADRRSWQRMGATPANAAAVAGRWMKMSTNKFGGAPATVASLVADLTKNDSPLLPRVRRTTLGGRKVVVISQRDGSKMYVANVGRPYPLRVESARKEDGTLVLSEFGVPFHITAPSNPIPND